MQMPLATVAEHGRGSVYEPLVAAAGLACNNSGATSATMLTQRIVQTRTLRIAIPWPASVTIANVDRERCHSEPDESQVTAVRPMREQRVNLVSSPRLRPRTEAWSG